MALTPDCRLWVLLPIGLLRGSMPVEESRVCGIPWQDAGRPARPAVLLAPSRPVRELFTRELHGDDPYRMVIGCGNTTARRRYQGCLALELHREGDMLLGHALNSLLASLVQISRHVWLARAPWLRLLE